jgi:hypothetical protein
LLTAGGRFINQYTETRSVFLTQVSVCFPSLKIRFFFFTENTVLLLVK